MKTFELGNLDLILNSVQDGVCVVTRAGRICHWNKAAESITGFKAAELLDKEGAYELMGRGGELGSMLFRDQSPMEEAVKEGRVHTSTLYIRHKNGYRLPVIFQVVPLECHEDAAPAVVEIFRPVLFEGSSRQRQAELEGLGLLDPATRLPNRSYLESQLHVSFGMLERTQLPFGVLMMHVDHIQDIHDTYGIEVRDKVLGTVSETLLKAVRPADVLGIWDESTFIGVFQLFTIEDLERVGRRCAMLAAQSRVNIGKCTQAITLSVGGTMPAAGDDVVSLVRRADALVRRSRYNGGNCTNVAAE